MVEELERKLKEANRKGLEEAENAASGSQQGEEGEGQQPAAGAEGQEEGTPGDGGEREEGGGGGEGERGKENQPVEDAGFLPPVTPANSK